ncbi:hypothetical protein CWI84_01815 [Idiomarina tyrosinivorans]|uniref:Glycosyl transferase family 25 domain-containing protein n=1 Tax=Idiomarina tyrosinivorans TaxID=1445662 RepID=A0A432ZUM9_9GAMM|nr:glycosyltransferase family 25 protein [Idiomarina tyrosinivorans]RUO81518.1 hypothetical protein CWI84_01815 [Idiomarina tyrosinivorans]
MRYQYFVINRERDKTRLEQLKNQFNKSGKAFTRVDAVDPHQITDGDYQRWVDVERNRRDYHHDLSSLQLAQYINHRRSWEMIVESGVDYGVVLEDDVILTDSFRVLANYIEAIDVPWNMIKLAEPFRPERKRQHHRFGAVTVVRYERVPRGCCAYAIKADAARELLERSEKIFRPVDIDMQWWWEFGLNVIGLKPYPVQLSHRLGRDPAYAWTPPQRQQRATVKWWQNAKFWWLNRQHPQSN